MDLNSLIYYLNSHPNEYEELYKNKRNSFLRLANTLFSSLPNCNISLLDTTNFNVYFRVIRSFSNKQETFDKWLYVKNIIDFILLNLVTIKYEEQCEYALKLLLFLNDILKRVQTCHGQLLDTNRILEVTIHVISDDVNNILAVLNILESITKFRVTLPKNLILIVEKTFVSLYTRNNVRGICLLAKFVLEKLIEVDSNISHKILDWILKKSTSYIAQDLDINIVEEILALILNLNSKNITVLEKCYPSFTTIEEKLWSNLMTLSNKLWHLCIQDHTVSHMAFDVLSRTLIRFLIKEEMIVSDNISTTYAELMEFFKKTTEVGYILEKHFFYICHMQVLHSSLVWEPKLVIRSMAELFYDEKSQLEESLLKSFFYLYPTLVKSSKPKYIAYGCDYLRYMDQHSENLKLFSFCEEQLLWILMMGSDNLKMEILRIGLKNKSYHALLIRVIIFCKYEKLLLDVLIRDSEEECRKLAAKFLQKLRNVIISKEIAEKLAIHQAEPNIFNCLLLSGPGLPDNYEKKMLLLELMVAVMPILTDNNVLKAACTYTNQLVKNLQNEQKCLQKFTTFISTIEFLLDSILKEPVDVCEKIFCLLKTLISVQVKHNYEIERNVDMDLVLLLQKSDSSIRTRNYLSILPIILKAKSTPLLKLKEESNLILWYNIMDFTEEPDTQDVGFLCLQMMMRKYDWLAFSSSVSNFIARCCYMKHCHEQSNRLMNFIIAWMKILSGKPKVLRPHIPCAEIESFVMRSGDMKKIMYFSKLLQKIH